MLLRSVAGSESAKGPATQDHPVAVMDSGVGGLSVLREIRRQYPLENLLYFADQRHVPYGRRPLGQIQTFSVSIVRFLLQQGAKIIVVACNTASAAALYHLRDRFPLVPIVGMEPAVKPAAEQTRRRIVGVMATPATFDGEPYDRLLQRYAQGVRVLEAVCPGLVEQVEAAALDTPETIALLQRCLAPLMAARIDNLVLGCTHYPFLVQAIRQVIGPHIEIVDPSPAVARQTGWVLGQQGLLNSGSKEGELLCYTTGSVAAFAKLATQLIGNAGTVRAASWDSSEETLLPPG